MGTDKRERQKAARQARLDEARHAERRAANRRRALVLGLVVVAVGAVIVISLLAGGDSGDDSSAAADCPPADGEGEPVLSFDAAPPMCLDPGASYLATFDTSEGEVQVVLDTVTTPQTANNFVVLARNGYYDGTELFRTDQQIGIIQGGAPHTNGADDPGPGYTIADEGGPFTYVPGELVMARTSAPDSAGAQFFFTVTDAASQLDQAGTYVVFGQVTEGLDVLETILALSDGSGSLGGAPTRPVTVNSVTITELPAGAEVPTTVGAADPTTDPAAEGEAVIVDRDGTPTPSVP